jgi:hypothetical protein
LAFDENEKWHPGEEIIIAGNNGVSTKVVIGNF